MHLLSVFSLRNRALIALVTIVVGVFGGVALTSLKQELIPSVTFPRLVIVTSYPGASPEVVNNDLSMPIESAIQGVPGLEGTTAVSTANASTVTASFDYGTDLATAEQKVQQAINRIKSILPEDVDPRILTGSLDDFPVVQIAVTSGLEPGELGSLIEASTLVDLRKLDDVREATLQGALGQRVTITPDAEELASLGLSVQSIRTTLATNGILMPGGTLTEDGSTLTVQTGTRIHSVEELQELPMLGARVAPGETVTLAEVAEVRLTDDPVTSISRVNGEPALTIAVTKTPAGNTVAVSQAVRAELPALAAALGSGTAFTVVFDQAPFIEQSIEALATEGLLGLVFAVIVILVFLLSIRSTLVTAISIPASVLIAFIGMLAADYTLNIITLGALTIAIGRVVDDSIVVIENIKRHLGLGEEKMAAITTAVKEVAAAITASTVTTVAVFLPLALVGDMTGELFRPFALTVTLALGASLFVSLTIVPVLAYWFLPKTVHAKHATEQVEAPDATDPAERLGQAVAAGVSVDGAAVSASAVSASAVPAVPQPETRREALAREVVSAEDELEHPTLLQRMYLPVIHWTLRFPALTLIAAILVLGGTVPLALTMKTNFIGDSGQDTFTVSQTVPRGTSLEEQDRLASIVEDELLRIDGIETVQLSLGSSGGLAAAFGGGGGITFSITADGEHEMADLQETVRDRLDALTGVGELSIGTQSASFASADIEVNITSATRTALEEAAALVLRTVRELDVTAQATSNLAEQQPYIGVVVDRAKAAEVGLTEASLAGIVSAAMQPSPAGSVVIDDRNLTIYLVSEDPPATLEELRMLEVATPLGVLELQELATVEQTDGPASITTIKGLRAATVSVTPNGDDVGTASIAVQSALDELTLPAGVSLELGGVTAQQADAFEQLGLALLVAILIVYVVMVATFKSLRQPLLLLVSVPFAATGGVILQVLSGVPLGVPSLIGVLMLIGIVVTNAIVLVDLVNQYRERGMRVGDALVHGASRRLRPILMTALATIFALLPMAIGLTGHGGFISQPLAIVVIGGLVSSTLLTLVVLPVLYYLVEGAKERRVERREAKAAAA